MSETHFQNTETALKNQQASIQGLETQLGQLSKLISERPQGSLPSNTEPNPREHLNAISTQDKEGFIAPEPELMQETVVSKGESEKLSFKEVHDPCSRNDRGHIYEEQRLWIEELDEWQAHKPGTHDKLKLRQNKPDTSPNQPKVGDKVLLDAVDPHIVTTTPNEEIPFTVLSIFPFDTVEVSHPKFGTFKHTRPGTRACLKPWPNRGRDTVVRYGRVEAGHDFPKRRDAINPHGRAIRPWVNLIGEHRRGNRKTRACQGQGLILFLRQGRTLCHHREARRSRSHPQRDVGDWVLPRYVLQPKFGTHSLSFCKLHRRSYFRYYVRDPSPQVVMTNNDDPSTIHFRLGSLVRTMSVPEFEIAQGLYTNEFMEEEDMNALPRNMHILPSLCWKALAPLSSTYDPSRSKASALAPSLRYLHATLAHLDWKER
ncbi:hypothetical protein GOBAR_AA00631 [Gossypium barbadense]|uniref:Uncharacterized protein n=1 Tax=Gossypium barbadense TaxID=3634 RepID=A0A2P5YWM2_GOSBA|nr:hypothetical protein GOBAR_AA00631 [Gossypium barbadense]